MSMGQFLLLYLLAGSGVAVAVLVSPAGRWPQVMAALIFWPLYLPVLLSGREPAKEARRVDALPGDELAQAIGQVDAELEGALQSLDGWAEGVLAREKDRLHELRGAWTAQAQRIRDMDRLLTHVEKTAVEPAKAVVWGTMSERVRTSQQVIQQNVARLRQVREQTFQDLVETLAWVRELASMIHLAKYTGAPASRAEELVAQIAAAVEGLSALSWQEETLVPPVGHVSSDQSR